MLPKCNSSNKCPKRNLVKSRQILQSKSSFTAALSIEKPIRPGWTMVKVVEGKVVLSYISTLLPFAVEPSGHSCLWRWRQDHSFPPQCPCCRNRIGSGRKPVPAVTLVTPDAPLAPVPLKGRMICSDLPLFRYVSCYVKSWTKPNDESKSLVSQNRLSSSIS